jgi:hypothetical protein
MRSGGARARIDPPDAKRYRSGALPDQGIRMRMLAFIVGLTAVTGASAGELDRTYLDGDAVTASLVYETRFGGEPGLPAMRSFQLQIANEALRSENLVPLRAEYRLGTRQFLVNGLDVERTLIARQGEEGGLAAMWGGWLPLAIVVGAASLIVVDGQDQDEAGTGTGGS